MKTLLLALFMFLILNHTIAQENKINAKQTKWSVHFDKSKLDSLHPESEFETSPIKGIWVCKNMKTDTLIFYPYYDGLEPIFWLERGLNANTKLPKMNSGPYHYILRDSTIKVQWFLAGSITYNPYFFKISNDSSEMMIEDFYWNNPYKDHDTLRFERIDK